MGKNWPKNRKWPSARNGAKMVHKLRKNGIWGHFAFFYHFWAIFSPFRADSHFLFFGQFFPIFGFRPVFRSIPGGLTRNATLDLCSVWPCVPLCAMWFSFCPMHMMNFLDAMPRDRLSGSKAQKILPILVRHLATSLAFSTVLVVVQAPKLIVAENGPFATVFLTPKIPPKKFMWVPFLCSCPGNEARKFSGVLKMERFGWGAKSLCWKSLCGLSVPYHCGQKNIH